MTAATSWLLALGLSTVFDFADGFTFLGEAFVVLDTVFAVLSGSNYLPGLTGLPGLAFAVFLLAFIMPIAPNFFVLALPALRWPASAHDRGLFDQILWHKQDCCRWLRAF